MRLKIGTYIYSPYGSNIIFKINRYGTKDFSRIVYCTGPGGEFGCLLKHLKKHPNQKVAKKLYQIQGE